VISRFGLANVANATVTTLLSCGINERRLSWGYVLTCAALFGICWNVFRCDDL